MSEPIDHPPGHEDAQRRENPDPTESERPFPLPLLALVAGLLLWGVGYILTEQRNDDAAWGDRRTASTLEAQATGAVDGAQLYAAQCAACHQASGAGLPGAFPPLAGSEWVTGDPRRLADIVLHGVSGALTVKGTVYNGQMPAFKDKLGDVELAALLSHLRTQFGNSAGAVDARLVAETRAASAARTAPWNGDDELAGYK
ncbi:cytochrome C oxidase Cbb3 [Massilia sp. KIM]|uniref:c-type cytochrome n=1 Tax=Massilia sp. KIM TaxID=1955422 RepID=UPI00098F4B26|nr:cytochrome c [Massilia sp. KIM]OON61047.1 cytochrome C oxidase Cbb3 [Massilia sp. KIM]